MDVLIKQLRTKYPDGRKEDRRGSSAEAVRDQQLGPLRTQKEGNSGTTRDQKSPPRRGETKKAQSWLKRQFSKQTSQDNDSSIGGEYQIAVAAAAFAVKSIEETRIRDEKKARHSQDTSHVPEPRAKSIKFRDEVSKSKVDAQDRQVRISSETSEKPPEKAGGLIPALKKKLSFADVKASSPPESALPEEKTIGPLLPSIKKPPTFVEKNLDRTPSRKPESTEPKPEFPPLKQPQFQPVDTVRQSPTQPGVEDNTADAWEKAELARIKEKYEKLNASIFYWENKKKKRAKRKLERIEAELDKRRAKAFHHYHIELARIDGVAGGARSKATENQRNEEFKVKEKANKIRLTGKVPATCLCC